MVKIRIWAPQAEQRTQWLAGRRHIFAATNLWLRQAHDEREEKGDCERRRRRRRDFGAAAAREVSFLAAKSERLWWQCCFGAAAAFAAEVEKAISERARLLRQGRRQSEATNKTKQETERQPSNIYYNKWSYEDKLFILFITQRTSIAYHPSFSK